MLSSRLSLLAVKPLVEAGGLPVREDLVGPGERFEFLRGVLPKGVQSADVESPYEGPNPAVVIVVRAAPVLDREHGIEDFIVPRLALFVWRVKDPNREGTRKFPRPNRLQYGGGRVVVCHPS